MPMWHSARRGALRATSAVKWAALRVRIASSQLRKWKLSPLPQPRPNCGCDLVEAADRLALAVDRHQRLAAFDHGQLAPFADHDHPHAAPAAEAVQRVHVLAPRCPAAWNSLDLGSPRTSNTSGGPW